MNTRDPILAELALAHELVARLERLSADSTWAHRASGLRGSLLRCLEQIETAPEAGGGGEADCLDSLVRQGFEMLTRAAREIRAPE